MFYVIMRMGDRQLRSQEIVEDAALRIKSRMRRLCLGGEIVPAIAYYRSKLPAIENWEQVAQHVLGKPASHPWSLEFVEMFGSRAN